MEPCVREVVEEVQAWCWLGIIAILSTHVPAAVIVLIHDLLRDGAGEARGYGPDTGGTASPRTAR